MILEKKSESGQQDISESLEKEVEFKEKSAMQNIRPATLSVNDVHFH